jgi:hypothetical protein
MPTEKTIETPEKLYELFEAYKQELLDNPIQIIEQVRGKIIIPKDFDGELGDLARITLPTSRPLTMAGFEVYAFKKKCCVNQYFDNPDDRYTAYITICSHIRKEIRQNQIEGGMAGIYNASITQRLNGLTDKQEIKTDQPTEIKVTVVKGKKK